ncbi:MAG: RAMP superfamily CRISPR-associated protein [Defluviicoccus sp.]
MTPEFPCLQIGRVTVEAATPLSIGTGLGSGLADMALVRDANGLPAIPGTTIAGVLRHLYAECYGQTKTNHLFGQAHRNFEQASRLVLSWGCVHDQNDSPVEGLLVGSNSGKLTSDPLLAWAIKDQPLVRDHVRINDRGSTDGRGKFDRTVLPAGYRFTFEAVLWCADKADNSLENALGLMKLPAFRLGGATRRGLGKLEVKRVAVVCFDLRVKEDRERLALLSNHLAATPGKLGDRPGFTQLPLNAPKTDAKHYKITLEPLDFWRMGKGDHPAAQTRDGKAADLIPLREPCVTWSAAANGSQTGKISARRLVVAGSAIKGALRHRAMFHKRRLSGCFADKCPADEFRAWQMNTLTDPDIECLFGSANDDEGRGGETGAEEGQAGLVLIDDAYVVDGKVGIMPHSSVDRLTQGVRHGFLFHEELVVNGEIVLQVAILHPNRVSRTAMKALENAMQDLVSGRLPIGGGSGKGHGFCKGKV